MVKNVKGGKVAKLLSRKSQSSSKGSEILRLPTCELEQYACVTKLYGNGMCQIYLNDGTYLIGHIRKKFTSRNKRNNLITQFTIVLIGLREWENPYKNCDILCIYDDNQIEQLKNIPSIDIRNVINMKNTNESITTLSSTDNVIFTNDYDNIKIDEKLNTNETFKIEEIDEINIDEI